MDQCALLTTNAMNIYSVLSQYELLHVTYRATYVALVYDSLTTSHTEGDEILTQRLKNIF